MKIRIRDKELYILYILGFTFVFFLILNGYMTVSKWYEQYSKKITEYNYSNKYYLYSHNALMDAENPFYDDETGQIYGTPEDIKELQEKCNQDAAELLDILALQNATTYIYDLYCKIGKSSIGTSLNIVLSYQDEWYMDIAEGNYLSTEEFVQGKSGVVIGESVLDYIEEINNKEYLRVEGTYYEVLGVFENYEASGEDMNVLLFYSGGEATDYLHQKLTDRLYNGFSVEVMIGGYEHEIDDACCTFEKMLCETGNLYSSDADYDVSARSSKSITEYLYNIQTLILTIMLLFGIINCALISRLWAIRRQRDFLIMRTYGCGNLRILGMALFELASATGTAIILALVIESMNLLITNGWQDLKNISVYGILFLIGIILLAFIIVITCIMQTIKHMNPAQGLKNL